MAAPIFLFCLCQGPIVGVVLTLFLPLQPSPTYTLTTMIFYVHVIDLVTVLEAILTSRQTLEKLQRLHENLMSTNFRKTAVPSLLRILLKKKLRVLLALKDLQPLIKIFNTIQLIWIA